MTDPDPLLVDVWAVWLTASEVVTRTYQEFLSPEEQARSERFVFDHLRQSYQLSQGVLRLLLGACLGLPARGLAFTSGPRGKPALCGDTGVRFNKSHSGALAVYAITAGCEVGIDVEELREIPDANQIASRYFCRAEASELLSLENEGARQQAFLRCWTRKEAYIKAVGDGLSMPLDEFQVTLLPEDPARFVHIGNDRAATAEWLLCHLDPAVGYVGAVACRDNRRSIRLHSVMTCAELLEAARCAGGSLLQ